MSSSSPEPENICAKFEKSLIWSSRSMATSQILSKQYFVFAKLIYEFIIIFVKWRAQGQYDISKQLQHCKKLF